MNRSTLAFVLFVISALLLSALYFMPMWRITLIAPQYPNGISMYIWINQITGDEPGTLQNINILNHYVGMKYIEPDSIPEFKYFPFVVMGLIVTGLLAAFSRKKWIYFGWFMLLVIACGLGIYDFYLWEYDYGHNLSDTAPIKIPDMAYQPPLFGEKYLLNFLAQSYPTYSGYCVIASLFLSFIAVVLKFKQRVEFKMAPIQKKMAFGTITLAALMMTSCTKEPQAIAYGHDHCAFCKMTIVDPMYGAELVTDKGKVFKFDASECMINYLDQNNDQDFAFILVNTRGENPGQLFDVASCSYLISENLPSPMGANLSAFENETEGKSAQAIHGGQLFEWTNLCQHMNVQPRFPASNDK